MRPPDSIHFSSSITEPSSLVRIDPPQCSTSVLSPRCDASSRTRRPNHPIDLSRHDEIVLVQSLDLLGAQRHGGVAPAETDVRVMAFGFGQFTNFLHECQGFPEI